jgi:hypothetical protein
LIEDCGLPLNLPFSETKFPFVPRLATRGLKKPNLFRILGKSNDLEFLEYLLQKGLSLKTPFSNNTNIINREVDEDDNNRAMTTPLTISMKVGSIPMAKMMLKYGADPTEMGPLSRTSM